MQRNHVLMLYSSWSETFEMSNWSLKVRSGLGLCWFEEVQRKGVTCVLSRCRQFCSYISYFAGAVVIFFFFTDWSEMLELIWGSQMLSLNFSNVCTGCASILHHEDAACRPQHCQVIVPSLHFHSALFPPASRPIQELLSLPLQPLTSILFISQIPSKPHPGHFTLRLLLLSLLHSLPYVVEDVSVFSLRAETSSPSTRVSSPESGAAAEPHSSFSRLEVYLFIYFFQATASVERSADGLYLEERVNVLPRLERLQSSSTLAELAAENFTNVAALEVSLLFRKDKMSNALLTLESIHYSPVICFHALFVLPLYFIQSFYFWFSVGNEVFIGMAVQILPL